jgi:hypothetical protein
MQLLHTTSSCVLIIGNVYYIHSTIRHIDPWHCWCASRILQDSCCVYQTTVVHPWSTTPYRSPRHSSVESRGTLCDVQMVVGTYQRLPFILSCNNISALKGIDLSCFNQLLTNQWGWPYKWNALTVIGSLVTIPEQLVISSPWWVFANHLKGLPPCRGVTFDMRGGWMRIESIHMHS